MVGKPTISWLGVHLQMLTYPRHIGDYIAVRLKLKLNALLNLKSLDSRVFAVNVSN